MKQVIKDLTSNISVGGDIATNILKECEFTFPVLHKQPPKGVPRKRCSEYYAANLQDNIHGEV